MGRPVAQISVSMQNPHQKSRFGCSQCKRRHVKCDRIGPRCANCDRRGEQCQYTQSSTISSLGKEESPDAFDSPFTSLKDLKLFHNFMRHTVKALIQETEMQDLLLNEVVLLGFDYPYVFYGLMAISALDLYHQDPESIAYYHKAVSFHTMALHGSRPYMENLTEEHAVAQFCFSACTTIYSLLMTTLDPYRIHVDPVENLLQFFRLVRGMQAVIHSHRDYLLQSFIGPLLKRSDNLHLAMPQETDEYHIALQKLRTSIFQEVPEHDQQPFLNAGDLLFIYLTYLRKGVARPRTIFVHAWPSSVQPAYLDRLAERRPMALVILAYFGVLLKTLSIEPGYRWLADGPKWLLQYISENLDAEKQNLLDWPRRMILGE